MYSISKKYIKEGKENQNEKFEYFNKVLRINRNS